MALGIGLLISTVVETQQQALFLTYSLLLVYLLMSGLFTPVRAMPDWAQWIALFNPVAHYVRLMRAVLLKGAGVGEVAPELAVLAAGAAIALTLAVRQYHKRAE
jgi:ABC-2 type transport system permease protein